MTKLAHETKYVSPRSEIGTTVGVAYPMCPNIPTDSRALRNLEDELAYLTSAHGPTRDGQEEGVAVPLTLMGDVPLENSERLSPHCDETDTYLAVFYLHYAHFPVHRGHLERGNLSCSQSSIKYQDEKSYVPSFATGSTLGTFSRLKHPRHFVRVEYPLRFTPDLGTFLALERVLLNLPHRL
nr:hypothetical protein [Deinococcus irradiatisoli]